MAKDKIEKHSAEEPSNYKFTKGILDARGGFSNRSLFIAIIWRLARLTGNSFRLVNEWLNPIY